MAVVIADTACVDSNADLEDDVQVGPFCVIGPGVRIGRGTRLASHVCIQGPATIGRDVWLAPFVVLHDRPGSGRIEIGDRVEIRSGTSVRGPSSADAEPTHIGPHARIGAGVRVGASSRLDESASLADGVLLGAGVHLGPHATVQGGVVVHPFVTLGRGCFVGGPSRVVHDIPPHLMADGHPSRVRGLNLVGARRRGLDRAAFEALREAYRLLIRARMSVAQAAEILESHGHLTPEVRGLIEFIQAQEGGRHGRARDRFRTAAASSSSSGESPEELEESR